MSTTEAWDICPICKEVRDDLGHCGCDYQRSGKEEAKEAAK